MSSLEFPTGLHLSCGIFCPECKECKYPFPNCPGSGPSECDEYFFIHFDAIPEMAEHIQNAMEEENTAVVRELLEKQFFHELKNEQVPRENIIEWYSCWVHQMKESVIPGEQFDTVVQWKLQCGADILFWREIEKLETGTRD